MKKNRKTVTVFAALCLCALSGIVQAQTFSISTGTFTKVGSTDSFTWDVTPLAITDITLAVGTPYTFSYGSFISYDFPISTPETHDQDYFTSKLFISPPGTTQSGTGQLDITATKRGTDESVDLDFVNSAQTVTFGSGGKYTITFLDSSLSSQGMVDLKATIDLLSEAVPVTPTPPDSTGGAAPVPEPGTMMLLGAGFLGLAAYGKRRRTV